MAAPAAPAFRSRSKRSESTRGSSDVSVSARRSSAMSSRLCSLPANVSFCVALPRSKDWRRTTARCILLALSDSIGGFSAGVSGRSGPFLDLTGLGVDAAAVPPGVTAPGVAGSIGLPIASPAARAASRFSRCICSYISSITASVFLSSRPPPLDASHTRGRALTPVPVSNS